ncbi:hypothetical protein AB3N62_17065 [Leptospira sp. WS4.C2]
MKQISIPTILLILLFNCADSERQNCRENLGLIEIDKNAALVLLLRNLSDSNPNNDSDLLAQGGYFAAMNEKTEDRKRKCDNDLILKIFSPETKDLQ